MFCGVSKLGNKLVDDESNTEAKESVLFLQQFVHSVGDFSSQYGNDSSISYTVQNIKGKPSQFPFYGDFSQSCTMRTYGPWWKKTLSNSTDFMPQNNGNLVSQDYIDIEFSKAVYPVRISIYEIYNPGSVIRIWAQDSVGKWFQLWSGPPQVVHPRTRIFSPCLHKCNFKTKFLRLEFNHDFLEYYTELDAVLLIGTTKLLIPRNCSHNKNISNLLEEISSNKLHNQDIYNSTPFYYKAYHDISILKENLRQFCVLYKSQTMENLPKSNLVIDLGQQNYFQASKFVKEPSLYIPTLCNEKSYSEIPNDNSITNCQPRETFPTLPDEIILRIFKHLDLKSLCSLCKVNKHLGKIASDPFLYKSLNLNPYWHCLNTRGLKTLLLRFEFLQHLDLSWCGNYNLMKNQDLIELLCYCGNLTHLRMNCCRLVNDEIISEISKSCGNLEELCLSNCTAVNEFARLDKLEYLQRLDLYRTNITTSALCAILRKNPCLKYLNLGATYKISNMDRVAIELGNSCPQLESVDFWRAKTLTPIGLRGLTRCTNLREVDFGWCVGMEVPGDSLRSFLSVCCNLEKVFLSSLTGLTDRDLEPLLLCKELHQLDLLGARNLTPDMCCNFLSHCLKLEMIDLSFCESISDVNVYEWRENYPHISIKKSFESNALYWGYRMKMSFFAIVFNVKKKCKTVQKNVISFQSYVFIVHQSTAKEIRINGLTIETQLTVKKDRIQGRC